MRIQKRYLFWLVFLFLFFIISQSQEASAQILPIPGSCANSGYVCHNCSNINWTCYEIGNCVNLPDPKPKYCIDAWIDYCYSAYGCGCNSTQQVGVFYRDVDGDGFGAGSSSNQCYNGAIPPPGYSFLGTDCNDNNVSIWKLSSYYPDIDYDGYGCGARTPVCSGNTPPSGYSNITGDCDCNVYSCNVDCTTLNYRDQDGDTFGNASVTHRACDASVGWVFSSNDCDDNVASCTTNCVSVKYRDSDGDSYGNASLSRRACDAPFGWVWNNTDCDDNINLCNVDCTSVKYYDRDSDSVCDPPGNSHRACDATGYYTVTAPSAASCTDCDVLNASKWRNGTFCRDEDLDTYTTGSMTVVCYGLQSPPYGYQPSCTAFDDCAPLDPYRWQLLWGYVDKDVDQYGNTTSGAMICTNATLPSGYTATPNDCDDNVYSCNVDCTTQSYLDTDQDTYCDDPAVSHRRCDASPFYNVTNISLCIDCDNIVPQCNVDCVSLLYADMDSDTYGNGNNSHRVCDAPAGYVSNAIDCDDAVPSIWTVRNFVVKYEGKTVAVIDNNGIMALSGGVYQNQVPPILPASFTVTDNSGLIVSAITLYGDLYARGSFNEVYNNVIASTAATDLVIKLGGLNIAMFSGAGNVYVHCVMPNFDFSSTPLS